MDKIVNQITVQDYTLLILDQKSNLSKKIKIGNQVFSAMHPFDTKNSIAIFGKGNFIGKNIEYL